MDIFQKITTTFIQNLGFDGGEVLFGNAVEDYILAVLLFLVSLALFATVQYFLLHWLEVLAKKTATDIDDVFVKIVGSFTPPFYFLISLWLALRSIETYGGVKTFLTAVVVLWAVYQAVIIMGILVEDVIFRHLAKDKDETTKSAIHLLTNLAKGVVWVLGLLLVFSNFGINVTSLMAGAGIAGIAVAFALQGILSDLFSSFSIYFDKPFRVGDFIQTGETAGVVKHIGIKSTRVQSLTGEEIVLSNQGLTSARIQNYKVMEERRVAFVFGVLYETSTEQLKKIPTLVKEIVVDVDTARFDRAHCKGFGESSIDYEVVYYVNSPDYNVFMDAQQEINFKLVDCFRKEGVDFAYPTRTVYLPKS